VILDMSLKIKDSIFLIYKEISRLPVGKRVISMDSVKKETRYSS